MPLKRRAWAAAALALIGCQTEAPAAAQVGATACSAGFSELASAFQRAHDAGDVRALEALVHADGLGEEGLSSFRLLHAFDAQYKVGAIRLLPLDPAEKLEYFHRGRTWRPNIRPAGRMEVTFIVPANSEGLTATSSTFLVGVVDGRWRIGSAIAVR